MYGFGGDDGFRDLLRDWRSVLSVSRRCHSIDQLTRIRLESEETGKEIHIDEISQLQ